MIGVGVFTSLGFQVKDIPPAFRCCCYGSSAAASRCAGYFPTANSAPCFPRSSGEYNFLRRAFHPAFGFLAGWLSATVGFAAPVALAAMAFGEYGKSIFPARRRWCLASGVVWLVSIVQLSGVQHCSDFQMVSTVLKVALIVAFLVAGFAFGTPQPISFAPSAADCRDVVSAPSRSALSS